jgi:hypothetical protein
MKVSFFTDQRRIPWKGLKHRGPIRRTQGARLLIRGEFPGRD